MGEMTQTTNINPLLANALAAQAARQNSPTMSLANSQRANLSAQERGNANKDITTMARMVASELGIPESMAYKIMRNLFGSGHRVSTGELNRVLQAYLEDSLSRPNETNKKIFEELRRPETQIKSDKELHDLFRPVIKDLQGKLAETRQQTIRNTAEVFSREDSFVPTNPQVPVTQLVNSPKEFASWLVNNKAAFVMLRSNPELTYLLMALANPNVQKSPVMMSEIAKLITQIIKMKRGRSQIEDFDDNVKESKDRAITQEMAEHEANTVYGLKNAFETQRSASLKDFLLEAERFAEEEIANLWSLTLKREKQLEKQLRENLTKFQRNKQGKPK